MTQHNIIRNRRGASAMLIVFLLVIAGLYAGYHYFSQTPRYALIQFKRAIVFKDPELVQKVMDLDGFVSRMGEGSPDETEKATIKKRIIHEINWPDQKSTFHSVNDWSVFNVPIQVSADNEAYATAEPSPGTHVTLERKSDKQWIITSIKFHRPQ